MDINKYLFIFVGAFFLNLGLIGIFVPLLPTTPFLILAAYCFNKGSPKFHSWLINHRILGPPIQDWNSRRVIKTKYKALASTMMLLSLVFIFQNQNIPLVGKVTVTVFLLALAAYIWRQKGQ
jgi:uncharacterized protein